MKYSVPKYLKPYNDDMTPTENALKYVVIGLESIKKNGVCVVILAGGQGTRLGTDDPKGCFILPDIGKSLFEIHCKGIIDTQKEFGIEVKLLIMTSEYTHTKTIEFFEKNGYFSLKRDNIIFFKQEDDICMDLNDKPLLLDKNPVRAPNGNGSIFKSMHSQNLYKKLDSVKYINVISVDNVLAKTVDPIVIGYMEKEKFDICNKAVPKRENENVGVFYIEDDKMIIREYSEMVDKHVDSGNDRDLQGNICNHTFTLDFIKKMAEIDLPTHKAYKKIPFTDINGNIVKPSEVNGYKKEKFIFDCLNFSKRSGLVSVIREMEFSPVKNGIDSKEDNPLTASRDYMNRNNILLKQAEKIKLKTEFIPLAINIISEKAEDDLKKNE